MKTLNTSATGAGRDGASPTGESVQGQALQRLSLHSPRDHAVQIAEGVVQFFGGNGLVLVTPRGAIAIFRPVQPESEPPDESGPLY